MAAERRRRAGPRAPVWHPLVAPPSPGAPGPDAEPAPAPSLRLRLVRAFADSMTAWPGEDRLEVVGPYGDFLIVAGDADWQVLDVGWGEADWEEVRRRLEELGYVRVAEGDPADHYRLSVEAGR